MLEEDNTGNTDTTVEDANRDAVVVTVIPDAPITSTPAACANPIEKEVGNE